MPWAAIQAPSRDVRRPGHNHSDRRLAALPRDYFVNPPGFGTDQAGRVVMPADGNQASQRVAEVQHRLVRAWLAQASYGDGARIAARFEVSASTWSRIVTGQRWAGSIGLAALITSAQTWPGSDDGGHDEGL